MTENKLTLHLDFRSGLPIYVQIVNQIKSQVASKVIKPRDQLPTIRALAQELGINFNTVARAYRILDEARIISTQQGRGTYITEIPPPEVEERLKHESLEALTKRFISEASRLGFSKREISQMVRDSLKYKKEASSKDTQLL
jgi:GntR family transcriptional regulator